MLVKGEEMEEIVYKVPESILKLGQMQQDLVALADRDFYKDCLGYELIENGIVFFFNSGLTNDGINKQQVTKRAYKDLKDGNVAILTETDSHFDRDDGVNLKLELYGENRSTVVLSSNVYDGITIVSANTYVKTEGEPLRKNLQLGQNDVIPLDDLLPTLPMSAKTFIIENTAIPNIMTGPKKK